MSNSPKKLWFPPVSFFVIVTVAFSVGMLQRIVLTDEAGPVASESRSLVSAHARGARLTPEEAEELERELAADPDSSTARASLIAYYRKSSPGRSHELVLEWIERDPASLPTFVSRIDAVLHPDTYDTASKLWLAQVEAHPDDVDVLRNAAGHLDQGEREKCAELLRRGEALDPEDPYWADRLGRNGLRSTPRKGVYDSLAATEALTAFERARELHAARGEDVPHRLRVFLANAALQAGEIERAREHASVALAKLEELSEPKNGTFGKARSTDRTDHVVHLILGLVAVEQEDWEAAENHLLASGRIDNGKMLSHFGPNMLLAKELIDRGRSEVVLEYFRLCGEFWDDAKLEAWAADVEEGRTPHFGANLSYCL